MFRKLERISLLRDVYYKVMATNKLLAFEALLRWAGSVTWTTERGKNPSLLVKFYKSDDFFMWKDYCGEPCFAYSYTATLDNMIEVQVFLEPFFREIVHPDKWHVSNQR